MLRQSAVPRWSHRDPVEGGNPFTSDGSRHAWDTATAEAKAALTLMDIELSASTQVTLDPAIYRRQLLSLALGRFSIWCRRGLAAVSDETHIKDYEAWLDAYVQNWLRYVGDTCPQVDARDELSHRLKNEARRWLKNARDLLSSAAASP